MRGSYGDVQGIFSGLYWHDVCVDIRIASSAACGVKPKQLYRTDSAQALRRNGTQAELRVTCHSQTAVSAAYIDLREYRANTRYASKAPQAISFRIPPVRREFFTQKTAEGAGLLIAAV
jgi:hypothetical protein